MTKKLGKAFDIRPTFDIKLHEHGFLQIEESFENGDDFLTRMEKTERGYSAIVTLLPESRTPSGFIIPEGVYFVSNIYNDEVSCFESDMNKRCTSSNKGGSLRKKHIKRKTHRKRKSYRRR